ncbi:MAG: glycosyltransferase family 2 protein [Alphaproteobacteria bacterium]|nr:glycosyltransferase family 2 protein [Alphaproteobacteria bacterium]
MASDLLRPGCRRSKADATSRRGPHRLRSRFAPGARLTDVALLIPALNEEATLPALLPRLAGYRVLVVDNGSTDATAARAREGGAELVSEPRRGYGQACLAGLAHLRADPPEVVVILAADGSDDPGDLDAVIGPALGGLDLVIGDRSAGAEPGSLTWPQRVGNRVATAGIRALTGRRFADMGSLRAIRWEALERMQMCDPGFGWNVEMQMKAVHLGLACQEVPVRYLRRHAGESKISGNVKGSVKAGVHMLRACWRHR